jgi:hypothetical protein
MQPGMDPMLPCVRGRETDWPPLWSVRRLSGASRTDFPEDLFFKKQNTQFRPEKTSEKAVAVEETTGKTSVPTRTAS